MKQTCTFCALCLILAGCKTTTPTESVISSAVRQNDRARTIIAATSDLETCKKLSDNALMACNDALMTVEIAHKADLGTERNKTTIWQLVALMLVLIGGFGWYKWIKRGL